MTSHRRLAAWADLRLAVAAAFAALGLAAAAGCGPSVPQTMKIGLLVPQTGPFAARGTDLLNGALLAADELNAAGFKVGGKPVRIEVVAVDDKGDNTEAAAGAAKLLESGVSAVIGPVNTPQAAATIPVLAAKKVPQFFTATATSLPTLGQGNVFRLLANDDLQGRAMAIYAIRTLGAKRIATIAETGDYGGGLNKAFLAGTPEVKGLVVSAAEVGIKDSVSRKMAEDIKAAKADLVVLFARDPQLKSLMAALVDVGYADVNILGTNVVRNKATASGPVPVRNLYATATAIDAIEFPAGRAFNEAFNAKFKSSPVWGAHYAYDCVYALTDAARRTGSLDAPALLKTLKHIDPITKVNLSMRFTESGEQRYPNVAVYRVERGAWVLQVVSANW